MKEVIRKELKALYQEWEESLGDRWVDPEYRDSEFIRWLLDIE